jgi:hypothetical protein
MSHRNDFHYEALHEHLVNRDWSKEQIHAMTHLIGRSALLTNEGVLEVLELQQETDELIEAQKECDRWAIGRGFATETFFTDTYRLPDNDGEALNPCFLQQQFEDLE